MVELLFDRDANLIGIRKVDGFVEHAYTVRKLRKGTNRMVSGTAFTNYYKIDTSIPTRRSAQMDGDVLVVDLNQPGTEVTSNRNQRMRQGSLEVS